MQQLNTNIRVGAIFESGRAIRPVWFDWQRQKYTISEITYRWQELSGTTKMLHFSVSDGQDLFELIYNTDRQTWILAGIEPGR
jgi:hypothetical protein